MVVTVFQVGHEDGQQGLALAYPVVHPLLAPPLPDDHPAQRAVRDRAGGHPHRPLAGFLDGPAVQVGIEGAHRAQDALELLALLAAVLAGAERLAPLPVKPGADPQVRVAGGEVLDLGPEQPGQRARQLVQGGVVHLGLAALQVVHEQLADALMADAVAVDQFLDRAASAEHGCPQRRRGASGEVARLVQHPPGQLPGELAAALHAAALEVQAVVAGFPHIAEECLGGEAG